MYKKPNSNSSEQPAPQTTKHLQNGKPAPQSTLRYKLSLSIVCKHCSLCSWVWIFFCLSVNSLSFSLVSTCPQHLRNRNSFNEPFAVSPNTAYTVYVLYMHPWDKHINTGRIKQVAFQANAYCYRASTVSTIDGMSTSKVYTRSPLNVAVSITNLSVNSL
jgi:hypothetical protein